MFRLFLLFIFSSSSSFSSYCCSCFCSFSLHLIKPSWWFKGVALFFYFIFIFIYIFFSSSCVQFEGLCCVTPFLFVLVRFISFLLFELYLIICYFSSCRSFVFCLFFLRFTLFFSFFVYFTLCSARFGREGRVFVSS